MVHYKQLRSMDPNSTEYLAYLYTECRMSTLAIARRPEVSLGQTGVHYRLRVAGLLRPKPHSKVCIEDAKRRHKQGETIRRIANDLGMPATTLRYRLFGRPPQ